MARWDEIFSLPVQNPPSSEFSSDEMVWSKVEGWRDNIDRVALIPFARVADFVRGESDRKDCPTRFHVEARRRRRSTTPYKPKVDGVLEYILYWCSFGPDDHRKGGVIRPSRNTYIPKKKKNAGRPNTKRGCTCHFIVKRLIAEPSVALVIYNEDKHIDKKGVPCHGPQDKKAAGTRAVFAPYISEELRLRVLSLLHVGVSVETIMQRHNESVERQGGPCNRDDLLTHRYVRRQERSIRRSSHELDRDDSVSVGIWVETHRNSVFFFEDFSDSEPFLLGIQTEWQLQQMIRFGNRSLLVSDSRFGTNKLKYPIYSVLVFNSDKKAIPVAWVISPRFSSSDTYKWMRALYNRVLTKDPSWRSAGFVIDDPSADVHGIRDVFQCSVLVSLWRLRHAWQKHLMQKCVGNEIRVEISKRLGQIVDEICKGEEAMRLYEDFVKDFIEEAEFMDYLTATWYPRLGDWIAALKTLPLASQETCAAVELYHNQLKLRLMSEKNPKLYQRTDWLVDKLNNKVLSHFWLDEYPGKDEFARYKKEEWASGLTSWRKALEIPDSDIAMDGKNANVKDQLDGDRVYSVRDVGSHFGVCDCKWAEMGNLCEHVIKAISMLRKKNPDTQSISLLQYHKALINMLNCPPRDSLICDHAVALAVLVQEQMKALVSGNQLVDERNSERNEDPVSQTGNENDDQNGLETSRNRIHGESTDMDVDEAVHLPSNGAADPSLNNGTQEIEMDVDSVNLDTPKSTVVTCQTDDAQPKSVPNNPASDTAVKKGTQESVMDAELVDLDTPKSTAVTRQTDDAQPKSLPNDPASDCVVNKETQESKMDSDSVNLDAVTHQTDDVQPTSVLGSIDVDKLSLDKTSSPMDVPVEPREVKIS